MKFFFTPKRLVAFFRSRTVIFLYKIKTFGKKPKTPGGDAGLEQYTEDWEREEFALIQDAKLTLMTSPSQKNKRRMRELATRMIADADTIDTQFERTPRAISGRLLHYKVQLRRLASDLEEQVKKP